MHKGSFISFASLLIFWLVVSGEVNTEHIVVGMMVSLFTLWFWRDLESKLPDMLSPSEMVLFGQCLIILAVSVIKSSIDVAKTMIFEGPLVNPIFLEMEPEIESDWGRVFLATCITITPGTVTIDVDPETNVFTVHALTRQAGEALLDWWLIDEIIKLEKAVKRRKANVLDNGRLHDSNSTGAAKSDHRTDRN